MTRIRRAARLFLPLLSGGAALALAFAPFLDGARRELYDRLVALRPPIAAPRDLLLLEADGAALERAGSFPWSRATAAELLVAMKELGAAYAVLDLPLDSGGSPEAAAPGAAAAAGSAQLSAGIEREFGLVDSNVAALFEAIRIGSVAPRDAERYVEELRALVRAGKVRLLETASGGGREVELLFGRAAAVFGPVYLGLEFEPESAALPDGGEVPTINPQRARFALRGLAPGESTAPPSERGAAPRAPAPRLPSGDLASPEPGLYAVARGAGYAGAFADPDGGFRAFVPLVESEGMAYAQVVLAAWLERSGFPKLELESEGLRLSGSRAAGEPRELFVPLDAAGRALLDGRLGVEEAGLRRLSLAALLELPSLEAALYARLKAMEKDGYLVELGTDPAPTALREFAEEARAELLAAPGADNLARYRELREAFLAVSGRFLDGPAEESILRGYAELAAAPGVGEGGRARLDELSGKARAAFAEARRAHQAYARARARLESGLAGAFCILAPAAGLPPTSGLLAYAAAGAPRRELAEPAGGELSAAEAAARFLAALESGRFVREGGPLLAALVAGSGLLVLALGTAWLPPAWALALGLFLALGQAAGLAALLPLKAFRIDPLPSLLALSVGGLAAFLAALGVRARERRALRAAFAARLAPAQLHRLYAEKEESCLHGELAEASVLSLRLRGLAPRPRPGRRAEPRPSAAGGSIAPEPGFASDGEDLQTEAAERREARRLVASLKIYHETVGGILTSRGATLLGMEGEFIFACFGAPLSARDHAERAAAAALALLASEEELRARLVAAGAPANAFVFRLGLDSGTLVFGDAGVPGFEAYAAVGPVAERSRLLVSLASRFGASVLGTEALVAGLGPGWSPRRLERLPPGVGEGEEYCYEILRTEPGAG